MLLNEKTMMSEDGMSSEGMSSERMMTDEWTMRRV